MKRLWLKPFGDKKGVSEVEDALKDIITLIQIVDLTSVRSSYYSLTLLTWLSSAFTALNGECDAVPLAVLVAEQPDHTSVTCLSPLSR